MVAVVQLAITLGAAGGGLLYDAGGYRPTFVVSATIFCLSAAIAFLSSRSAGAHPHVRREQARAPT